MSTEKKAEKKDLKKGISQKGRGKKYLNSSENLSRDLNTLEKAVELAKKVSYANFDVSIDLHIRTQVKKGQELLRGLIDLPAGAPKTPKIKVADENVIADIKKNKIDFDILLAEPKMMPKLATVAKILGPRGLMPNPKSGTVVEDPEKTKKEFSGGKVEYKSDALGNIHLSIGKKSWKDEDIVKNAKAIISAIPVNRIMTISIAPTMGKSIKVNC